MKRLLSISLLLIAGLLAGCAGPAATVAPTPAPQPVKFVVLQILDALPMYVAQQEGLFAKYGVQVELVPAGAAPERDQLIASGQADGMINEVVSTLFFNKEEVRVQIVRYARAASSGAPLFSILASQKSGITGVAGLKGVPVAVSDGTVIAYLTDRMLAAEGFTPEEIKTVAVPSLRDRAALLGSGELQAGVLPEPLATLTASQGAKVVLADTAHPDFSFSTISFRKATLDSNPAGVRAFLAAVEEAVTLINQNPQKYVQTLVDSKILPQPLAATFKVPQYVTAGVPSKAQYDDALAWAKQKGYVTTDLPYDSSVTPAFLPAKP